MKAWWVRFYDGDEVTVVWAATRGKARRLAASELGDSFEWMEIQAKRLPAADDLTDRDLTPQWWLDHNFYIRCSWCEAAIYSDEEPVITKFDAYCNAECQAKEEESRAKYRARAAETEKRIGERLRESAPTSPGV